MIRRPPRSTRTDTLFPTRRSSDLLADQAQLTLRATKEALRRLNAATAEVDDKDLIVLCYTSEDFREGLEAFLAQRKPDWKGRRDGRRPPQRLPRRTAGAQRGGGGVRPYAGRHGVRGGVGGTAGPRRTPHHGSPGRPARMGPL